MSDSTSAGKSREGSSEGDLIRRARAEAAALPRSASPPETGSVFAPLPPAGTFPGYEVIRVLSRGGQGVVYLALQQSTRRQVAIKVPREGSFARFDDLARFEREMETLAKLDHPNIVTILDRGTADGRHWFAMDFIAGPTLDLWVGESQRSREEVLDTFAKICRAVHAAHMQGIIHRDLKPANIRVDPSGEPHILDFGLAKSVSGEDDPFEMTQAGDFVGTPVWASPEQLARDPTKVDTRTDIYSLGLILYKLLTGRSPFAMARHRMELLEALRRAGPEPASSVSRDVDDELSTIVDKCLRAEQTERYQSVSELARDIAHYLANEPIEAKRDSRFYLLRKLISRHRAIASVAALAILLVAAAAVTATLQRNAARAAAARAEAAEAEARRSLAERDDVIDYLVVDLFESVDPTFGNRADFPVGAFLVNAAADATVRLGVDPRRLAFVLLVIGRSQHALGDLRAARSTLARSVETWRRLEDFPALADALSAYGRVLLELRELPGAAAAHEEARRLRIARYGTPSTPVAMSVGELAAVAFWEGRPDEAITLDQEAATMLAASGGLNDWRVVRSLHQLALRKSALGRHEEAARDLRDALERTTRLFGVESTQAATVEAALGSVLTRVSRDASAEGREHLRRSIAVESRLRAPDDYRVAHRRVLLAQSLFAQAEDQVAAEAELRNALEIFRMRLPAADFRTQNALSLLGRALILQGRLDEAEAVLGETLGLMASSPPTGARIRELHETRLWLGRALVADPTRRAEGATLMREAADELERLLGPEDRAVRRAREWIERETEGPPS
ncbi:MAG TPA: serine/threonine-protein kinase [Phycisphaerales bacterium]|nr:serine/threonine-protein kinase [Phycisphaerales bacterium]HMP37728.1 serine/threonine-protein kinase [Phycisphaerales bacterium]